MRLINEHEESVKEEWIDYNGHMNVAFYVLVFDHGTDAILERLGLGETYRKEEDKSIFVVESHLTYDQEVHKGDELLIKTCVMSFDSKRIHLFHEMYQKDTDVRCATNEIMALHIDMKLRKSAIMSQKSLKLLDQARGVSIHEEGQEKYGRAIIMLQK